MENIVEEYFDQTDTDDLFVRPILFVGENRSNMAQEKDWSWERCQLEKKPRNCANQLFDALEYCGIDPYDISKIHFINAFEDDLTEWVVNEDLHDIFRFYCESGFAIVSLGNRVHRHLEEIDIPHIQLIHPAARGKIRKKENYREHVRERLFEGLTHW
ncbi:MAG TPA: hypothetical protein VJY47_01995 [Candidatus Dojkabacteria bacterium]|nr:hypothetical protein [Candidatus Dojkabacteria bacterium]